MNNYLKQIDSLIDEPYNNRKSEYLEKLADLIQDFEQIQLKNSYNEFLFDKENEIATQKFIAYCLIRIISNQNEKFIKSKHLVFKLIQETLPDICGSIGVTDKIETYEKEKLIREFVKEREQDFTQQLDFNGAISDLKQFQTSFRRFVNNKRNSLLLMFTESLLNRTNLDRVFTRIVDYLEATEDTKYPNFLSAKEAINQFIDDATDIETRYSSEYIAKPFKKILSTISRDMESSPYYLPCELAVFQTEKKYPLFSGIKNTVSIGIINKGKGYAHNVMLSIKNYDKDKVTFLSTEQLIGNLKLESSIVEFEYQMIQSANSLSVSLELSWNMSDGTFHKREEVFELQPQAVDVDWDLMSSKEPYNLEPVVTDAELIGRESILQKLKNALTLPIGSSYIFGQRRVGKTSIVKTLEDSNKNSDLLIYYVDAGEWNGAQNAFDSMDNLGEKICKRIQRFNPKFRNIPIPHFGGSFNKISDFLDEVLEIDKSFQMLLILDEFDRISRSLFERGEVAKSFVLTIRSISNRRQIGFILVGGETLEYILSQWQEFNKFSPVRVDYFSKERDWEDFRKLIKNPVEGFLEFSDSAINAIYEETAGNPYFTKKICMELYANMVSNRDIHVTVKEVKNAISLARNSSNIGATDFSHFWEDGIKGKANKEEETSINRRKILIAATHLMKAGKTLTKDHISDIGIELGLKGSEVERFLVEFEQRRILYTVKGEYFFVVNFFKEWLVSGGVEKIMATFEEEERVSLNRQIEERTRIKTEEILELLSKPKIYKGQEITVEQVRNWLEQFDDIFEQRLIFKLLQNFKLYSDHDLRLSVESLFGFVNKGFVKRGLVRNLESKKRKREDILVSYLDKSPAKGAPYITKLFADENNIYTESVCTPEAIAKKIMESTSVKCLVILDDFIGSGNTIISNVKSYFNEELCNLIRERKVFVIVGAITGFAKSKELIEEKLGVLDIELQVVIVDLLNDNDKCFSSEANIFANPAEIKRAKDICFHKGEDLDRRFPLGYSDCQSLVAFPMNCPNNTLPIFWKKATDWKPLFERNS